MKYTLTAIAALSMLLSPANAATVEVFTTHERPLNALTLRLFPFLADKCEDSLRTPLRPIEYREVHYIAVAL